MSSTPKHDAPRGNIPTGVVHSAPSSTVLAQSMSNTGPHGNSRRSGPAAAYSHSASRGSRKRRPRRRDSHAAYASAAAGVTVYTGWFAHPTGNAPIAQLVGISG